MKICHVSGGCESTPVGVSFVLEGVAYDGFGAKRTQLRKTQAL